jgi:glycosyltransferase involved in cell wall biosynthesis
MNTYFIGSLYPEDRIQAIRSNCKEGGIDNAANNFQRALIKGLDFFYPNLKIITQPNLRTFPLYYKKVMVKESKFAHTKGANDECLAFINIPLIKHISKYITLISKLKSIIPKHEKSLIFVYGVSSPFIRAVSELKQSGWNKIQICLIVPDLPQYMVDTKNIFYHKLKKIDFKIIEKHMNQIDSFVFLTKYMTDFIDVNSRPWTIVEGVINNNYKIDVKKEKYKTILYTGNLDERYGVLTLLEAFKLIKDKNYRLWIRGNGKTKDKVIEEALIDQRITYFDEMPIKELYKLLKRATVLINPVKSSEEFTKYFFPSKIMNYLASGTPVISTYIKGIPEEYLNYLFITETDDSKGLKDVIVTVCEKQQLELNCFGEKASKFIFENKNSIKQAGKIVEMLNKCN